MKANSRSGETRIIKKINQENEHIKIPHFDKVVDDSVAMQRQEPLDAELAQGPEVRWERYRVCRTKVPLFDPGIHMSLMSTVSQLTECTLRR